MASRIKCSNWAPGKKCDALVRGGEIALCVWSDCQMVQWKKEKFCYFCNTDVRHCWKISKVVLHAPSSLPTIWPIEKGTHMKKVEAKKLVVGGFDFGFPLTQIQAVIDATTPLTSDPNVEERQRLPYRPGVSKLAYTQVTYALTRRMHVEDTVVKKIGIEEVFKLKVWNSADSDPELIDVVVRKNPSCSCKEFQERVSLKKRYLACSHLYYVFLITLGQDVHVSMHIHQSKIAPNIVHDMLTQAKRT
ncbi:hypothetical protein GOP47_0023901 [Adiantum capillus-veneris]|uniref:SWIM-type domain-containing protein n=1 Tax=Adiantum capillus-veneris TaxID=13818 RepID=A0A9D4U6W8_ADICA|nr:hypothetical protein GOP47_0023901 [Adiantum capillus-veneris]